MLVVSDGELQEFCKWYKNHFSKNIEKREVLVVCLCGHFHTYPKLAKELIKRSKSLNLLDARKDDVYLK